MNHSLNDSDHDYIVCFFFTFFLLFFCFEIKCHKSHIGFPFCMHFMGVVKSLSPKVFFVQHCYTVTFL